MDGHAGWEDAMLKLLKGIRAQETSFAIRMARIRACNMALYFFITPLVSCIVFTVVSIRVLELPCAEAPCMPASACVEAVTVLCTYDTALFAALHQLQRLGGGPTTVFTRRSCALRL